ncbi:expressed unknown protein [Seminavis robusta]|uniref:Uncharacterized protein n=1 Tax=Seminavis robusta TaxID=568900 RepID=A0A9N8ENM0_9STRA|nr:expressed unknown protein [Seminavis robusta]|eukprot:Sro1290_g259790.1 n/a (148) ;mRNA; f:15238-16070
MAAPLMTTIDASIFCDEVLSFLHASDIVTLAEEIQEISIKFRLQRHFCAVHGQRLEALSKKRKRLVDSSNSNSNIEWREEDAASNDEVEAYYQHDRCFREWCTKNPVLQPESCTDCRSAQKGLERCVHCDEFVPWSKMRECQCCQVS